MPFCANCGSEVPPQAAMCPRCGQTARASSSVARRTESSAVASLVLGIAGFFVCPLVLHILPIIFGNQAQTRIRQDPTLDGEGLARAGVILGWIGVGLAGVFIVFVLFAALLIPFA
jgi:hypothetical protein